MGLFDFLKPKKAESLEQRLARFEELSSDEEKLEAAEQLFTEIAPQLEGGEVKKDPQEGEVDLRGRAGGFPVKVTLSLSSGSVGAVMKAENRLGDVDLVWNPSATAKPAGSEDPFADEDISRVFVAKGIYVETFGQIIDEHLAVVQRLPPPFFEALVSEMPRLGLSNFGATPGELTLAWAPAVSEMQAPREQILGGIGLLHRAAGTFGTGDRDPAEASRLRGFGAPHCVKCAYCGTLFLLGEKSQCPNCGAPYGG